jgi:hypothetical protein
MYFCYRLSDNVHLKYWDITMKSNKEARTKHLPTHYAIMNSKDELQQGNNATPSPNRFTHNVSQERKHNGTA